MLIGREHPANQLDLTIAGSGNLEAGGEVDRLDLTIAGDIASAARTWQVRIFAN